MPDLWNDLLGCLDLRSTNTDVFEGPNQQLTYHRLFGGQLLAQMARAAELACPSKSLKSLHVLFPRAGRTDEPVHYEVERLHEGKSFASLRINARQSPGVMATATVSMHAAEDGRENQTVAKVPAVLGPEFNVEMDLIPWETRSAGDLNAPASEPAELEIWMRTPQVAPELAPALTAYGTDLTLIGTALRPLEGISQLNAQTGYTSAVTSHNIWFHRPFRTDNWLLLRQHSPILAHGRCFGRGDVLTEDGALVASYAQEALLRFAQ